MTQQVKSTCFKSLIARSHSGVKRQLTPQSCTKACTYAPPMIFKKKKPSKNKQAFCSKGGCSATFFSHQKSGFIQHQLPPACYLNSTTTRSCKIIYPKCTGSKIKCLYKEVSDDITKATSDWEKVWPFRTNSLWGSTFWTCPYQSPWRATKRQKQNIKYSENITFGETQHCTARKLSTTIKETQGTAQSYVILAAM